MKKILLLLIGLVFSQVLPAQNISGSIKDKINGEALIGATVLIKGTSTGASADINGEFTLNLNQPLPLVLLCSYIGYVTEEITVNDANARLNIRLIRSRTDLSEVNITDTRLSDKQKEAPLTVESMDIIAIKETPAANFYEGLGQLKGVDLTSASIGFKIINTRGFNSTSPVRSLQIIDGVDNQSPGLNFSLGNFLGCSDLDVLKVDIVAGASSAFYGPNAFNGVVSMETKSPFVKPGFEISAKTGTRDLLETAMRYAFVIKDKDGTDKLGMKFNAYFLKVRDWEANNLSATAQSPSSEENPGRYDAVNVYGDEYNGINDATSRPAGAPGLGIYYRKGYAEKDLVDYDTRNIKLSGSVHYKVRPENEIIYTSSFGYGTTVYQGDNRYSLKDIRFFQNKLEYRKQNKFFIRIYETHEDAGKSYDAYFTALLLQRAAKKDETWNTDYLNYYNTFIRPKVMNMPGYIPAYQGYGQSYLDSLQVFLSTITDSLTVWHGQILNYASTYVSNPAEAAAFYEPGTPRFDSAFAAVTSKESFSQGGSKFYDRSALYHIHGEYKFKLHDSGTDNDFEFTIGANGRMYRPNSRGTIFSDTIYYRVDTIYNSDNTINRIDSVEQRNEITNSEYGIYAGVEKQLLSNKLRLKATARLDKNENFDFLVSPAISGIYRYNEKNIFRATFSSAIRNPTLTDQYLYYPVGRAILLGNLSGFDSIATIPSLIQTLNTGDEKSLQYFNVAAVQPEKVKTFEVGYRATLFNHLYMDLNYYFSIYNDFIGYRIGAKVPIVYRKPDPFSPIDTFPDYNNIKILRIASNSQEQVTTQGASIGLNYFFSRFYSINGNYTFNQLNKDSEDPLIPAYNTPKNKFNIGVSGRDITTETIKNWGFSINYKWVEGFLFEGSPQFTGTIDSYDMVDVQVNKRFPEQQTTFKIGIQNLLNNKHYEVYGGPLVGRLAYFQITVEIN